MQNLAKYIIKQFLSAQTLAVSCSWTSLDWVCHWPDAAACIAFSCTHVRPFSDPSIRCMSWCGWVRSVHPPSQPLPSCSTLVSCSYLLEQARSHRGYAANEQLSKRSGWQSSTLTWSQRCFCGLTMTLHGCDVKQSSCLIVSYTLLK